MKPETRGFYRRSSVFATGLQHLVNIGRVSRGHRILPEQQPVYIVSSHEINPADHLIPSHLEPKAWRLFAGQVAGTAVVGEVSDGENPELLSLAYGTRADETLAINLDPEFQSTEFERRTLRVPDKFVEALWLKSSNTDNDLIVPLGLNFVSGLKSGRSIPVQDFFKLL